MLVLEQTSNNDFIDSIRNSNKDNNSENSSNGCRSVGGGSSINNSDNYHHINDCVNNNLKQFMNQNHKDLTWEQRIEIFKDIISSLSEIYQSSSNLHDGDNYFGLDSGSIFQDISTKRWKFLHNSMNSKYGRSYVDGSSYNNYSNLPYMAPEILCGKQFTSKSDIYSIGMVMWEISAGHSPFLARNHDLDLISEILKGRRPKIIEGTPAWYSQLMQKCWDVNPERRPDLKEIYKLAFQVSLSPSSSPSPSSSSSSS